MSPTFSIVQAATSVLSLRTIQNSPKQGMLWKWRVLSPKASCLPRVGERFDYLMLTVFSAPKFWFTMSVNEVGLSFVYDEEQATMFIVPRLFPSVGNARLFAVYDDILHHCTTLEYALKLTQELQNWQALHCNLLLPTYCMHHIASHTYVCTYLYCILHYTHCILHYRRRDQNKHQNLKHF